MWTRGQAQAERARGGDAAGDSEDVLRVCGYRMTQQGAVETTVVVLVASGCCANFSKFLFSSAFSSTDTISSCNRTTHSVKRESSLQQAAPQVLEC